MRFVFATVLVRTLRLLSRHNKRALFSCTSASRMSRLRNSLRIIWLQRRFDFAVTRLRLVQAYQASHHIRQRCEPRRRRYHSPCVSVIGHFHQRAFNFLPFIVTAPTSLIGSLMCFAEPRPAPIYSDCFFSHRCFAQHHRLDAVRT